MARLIEYVSCYAAVLAMSEKFMLTCHDSATLLFHVLKALAPLVKYCASAPDLALRRAMLAPI